MANGSVVAGLIGAGMALLLAAIPFFVGWGSIQATIEALKTRLAVVEEQAKAITEIREALAYIRGKLDQALPATARRRGTAE